MAVTLLGAYRGDGPPPTIARMLHRNSISTIPMPPLSKPLQNCTARMHTTPSHTQKTLVSLSSPSAHEFVRLEQAEHHRLHTTLPRGLVAFCFWLLDAKQDSLPYRLLEGLAVVDTEARVGATTEASSILIESHEVGHLLL